MPKTLLSDLTAEVSEVKTARHSSLRLMAGLKARLDAGIKDAEAGDLSKLRFLAEALDAESEALAGAVSANTAANAEEHKPAKRAK